MPELSFISGVPATGKTWLGSWLAESHGFIHIDAEKDNGADFDRAGIHREWDEFLNYPVPIDPSLRSLSPSKPALQSRT